MTVFLLHYLDATGRRDTLVFSTKDFATAWALKSGIQYFYIVERKVHSDEEYELYLKNQIADPRD